MSPATATCTIQLLDRAVTTSGSYIGSGDAVYYVQILDDSVNPNTYQWKKDVGGTYASGGVLPTSATAIAEGVSIAFAKDVGHTAGQTYTIAVTDTGDVVGDAILQSAQREWKDCSNRGVCDTRLGTCTCADGYDTSACGAETNFVAATDNNPASWIRAQSTSFAGAALLVTAEKGQASDFNLVLAKSNDVPVRCRGG